MANAISQNRTAPLKTIAIGNEKRKQLVNLSRACIRELILSSMNLGVLKSYGREVKCDLGITHLDVL